MQVAQLNSTRNYMATMLAKSPKTITTSPERPLCPADRVTAYRNLDAVGSAIQHSQAKPNAYWVPSTAGAVAARVVQPL
jgi:hypothetical protein